MSDNFNRNITQQFSEPVPVRCFNFDKSETKTLTNVGRNAVSISHISIFNMSEENFDLAINDWINKIVLIKLNPGENYSFNFPIPCRMCPIQNM